jgi:hypothetical protein
MNKYDVRYWNNDLSSITKIKATTIITENRLFKLIKEKNNLEITLLSRNFYEL